ncbi:hypothetical protein CJU90_0692 [Yarrowia sp. C11]|nr:hypothetical protein CKK34_2104 [Yarrowia sp. E02]KAG5373027.1 hypothetical protein CJU90_0692 [Yarrowia sp. C11]
MSDEWRCDMCRTEFQAADYLVHQVMCNGTPYMFNAANETAKKEEEPEVVLVSQRKRRNSLFKPRSE